MDAVKRGASAARYLATRGDSSVKRRQPLVIFGVNPGSLTGRRQQIISQKSPHSLFRHLEEDEKKLAKNELEVRFYVVYFRMPGVASSVAGKCTTPTTLFQA